MKREKIVIGAPVTDKTRKLINPEWEPLESDEEIRRLMREARERHPEPHPWLWKWTWIAAWTLIGVGLVYNLGRCVL